MATNKHRSDDTDRRSRARRRGRGLWCAAALALVAPAARDALAEDPTEAPDFERTPLEDEVWKLYGEGKLITARRRAEELLRTDPDSVVGLYVMGNVLRQAEGDLPEAMKMLGRAREIYEQRHPGGSGGRASMLHRELLYSIAGLAGELEKYAYQLEILDYYDSLYSPRLTGEHAWPLMKLGRFDDAREKAEKAKASRDPYQRSLGLNALCAIEGVSNERAARFDACVAAFDAAIAQAAFDPPDASPEVRTAVTVHAYNAALAASGVLRADEAERLAIEGTKRRDFTVANPWRVLLLLYTGEGRAEQAVHALREMHEWRKRQPPYLRDQVRAEIDAAYATFLLVAGEPERGLRAITRALEFPDRQGARAATAEQALGAHALIRHATTTTLIEVQRERASWVGGLEAWRLQRKTLDTRLSQWADSERIANVLSDDDRLVATMQTGMQNGLSGVPNWLLGDLVDVLGPGVVYVALDAARGRERKRDDGSAEILAPVFDAIEAEVHLAWGDVDTARRMAEEAADRLPASEVLLRARALAVAARACQRRGDFDCALGHLSTVLDLDGSVIRRMGLRIPARITRDAAGEGAERLEVLLGRSPRLSVDPRGLTIHIEEDPEANLRVCLLDAGGSTRFCAMPSLPLGEDGAPAEVEPTQLAGLAAEAFHKRAFAMAVVISNVDLASLDGTATVASEVGRERVQNALDRALNEIDAPR